MHIWSRFDYIVFSSFIPMLKSNCDEEHSFKHSMIRSYIIETFDHGSILLSGDFKSNFF